MLRIPTEGDVTPPLVAATQEPSVGEQPTPPSPRRRRKLRHDPNGWGDGGGHQRGGRTGFRVLLISGALVLAAVIVGVFFFTNLGVHQGGDMEKQVARVVIPPVVPVIRQADLPLEERSPSSLLAEIQPLVEKFMAANSVEALLPLVRNPSVAEARMRGFYRDGKVVAQGLSKIRDDVGLSIDGNAVGVAVLTLELEEKGLSLVKEPDGFKIDWESWVGWSEMPWDEFLASKPTTSRVFRVTLYPVDYYNHAFSDESKWQSYRAESIGNEQSVFAYAGKETVVSQLLYFSPDMKSRCVMLALKFPQNAESSNQVEIERFVKDGWIENVKTP
ncbi:MAG: hypothetical protein ORN51_03685 [Akkermansiaceae bacterium]|nr:hypothetical protein [Akkermansiaceae bacterium]